MTDHPENPTSTSTESTAWRLYESEAARSQDLRTRLTEAELRLSAVASTLSLLEVLDDVVRERTALSMPHVRHLVRHLRQDLADLLHGDKAAQEGVRNRYGLMVRMVQHLPSPGDTWPQYLFERAEAGGLEVVETATAAPAAAAGDDDDQGPATR